MLVVKLPEHVQIHERMVLRHFLHRPQLDSDETCFGRGDIGA